MAFLMFPMGGSVHSEEQPRVTHRFPCSLRVCSYITEMTDNSLAGASFL